MRIAVDARFYHIEETGNYFIKELFCKLAKEHSAHHFIFLFDKKIPDLPALPVNVTPVIITPTPTNIVLYKWWYDVKVPLALKRNKADIFVCVNGLCSSTTQIPQLLIVQDLAFLHNPVFFSKHSLSFYKRFIPVFLKKAVTIAVFSDFIKREIISTFKIPEQKIAVIDIAADSSFQPLEWEEREKVKEQYAQGCEYFIFTGGLNPGKNLINLLKAFSIFKKWQKTNMKLVITVNAAQYKDQFEKLSSYKYRNEICLAENLPQQEQARVTGAAYALIFPSLSDGLGTAVLEAMQCEVPVITSPGSSMSEIAGEAALYADPVSAEEIAEQMKCIFKDEQLRNKLIAAGKERVYGWDKTLALTWKLIQQAVSK